MFLPTITTLSRLASRLSQPNNVRAGERALVLPTVRRQPGLGRLRQWRTHDSAGNGSNGADGHGQVRAVGIKDIASQIIKELNDCHVICLGPVVRGDSVRTPAFYAAICSSDGAGFFSLIVGAEDLDDAVRTRVAIRDRLREMGRCVMEFGSELKMAREVSELWPCAQTEAVLATVEAGR
jgi:hypothetical protein